MNFCHGVELMTVTIFYIYEGAGRQAIKFKLLKLSFNN